MLAFVTASARHVMVRIGGRFYYCCRYDWIGDGRCTRRGSLEKMNETIEVAAKADISC